MSEDVTRKIKLFHCFENKKLTSLQVLETFQTGRAGVCDITALERNWSHSFTVYSWKAQKGPEVSEVSGNVSPYKL